MDEKNRIRHVARDKLLWLLAGIVVELLKDGMQHNKDTWITTLRNLRGEVMSGIRTSPST